MAIVVLALAGLTVGDVPPDGAADGAAVAEVTVSVAGHWKGTIQDDEGTHDLELNDEEAQWESRRMQKHGTMRFVANQDGRVLLTWQGWYCPGWGRDGMNFIPFTGTYRGVYQMQGDRIVLCLAQVGLPAPTSLKRSKYELLITLRRVASSEPAGGVGRGRPGRAAPPPPPGGIGRP